MTRTTFRWILMTLALALPAVSGLAQETPSEASAQTETAVTPERLARDSYETRTRFAELLRRQPTELGTILRLDPTLLSNEAYLSTYPALAAFVAEHAEVAHNPAFFLESFADPGVSSSPGMRVFEKLLEGVTIFCSFLLFNFAVAWLIRTFIEQRRWSRLSKVQTEVHTKLLDRFTGNEDLLAYIQSSAGKKFLESAPIPVGTRSSSVSAPVERILWSVQLGVVVAAGSLGLVFVSSRFDPEIARGLSAMGVIGLSVGIGFLLSGVVSLVLSRKLGLWEPPASPDGPESENARLIG